jgi:NADPH:quinone reductase-like Zn-dependent oxidoreductase
MRAAVIRHHGGPEALAYETAYPDPRPEAGEVLIRVDATSLNYHDIFTRRGLPGINVPLPCIAGIDFAGQIVEAGQDVEGWRAGDRVLVDPIDRVAFGGLIGEMRPGGFAELCAVPAHHLVKLPDDVSFEAASCLPVAYGTALRMMVTIGRIKSGERVLILGASGGVGTCCVQLAKNAGCEVIACASSREKLDRLQGLGADGLIDYTKEDFVKTITARYGKPHRRTFTGGVDVVVNFTGGDTWVPSLRVLHRQGRLLTCGATAGFDPKEDIRFIWTFELQVLGSNGWMREELVDLIEMVRKNEIAPVIDRVLPLEEASEAFRLLESRKVFGKVVIKP